MPIETLLGLVNSTDLLSGISLRGQGGQWEINDLVRTSDHLPAIIWIRMQQMERIQRWLKGYLQAVGILLQIPGAPEYRGLECDSALDLRRLIWNVDTASTLSVMAAALQRLDARHVLAQVPGGKDFEPLPLAPEAHVCLAGLDHMHLLNVVADCLDRLLVVPNIPGELENYHLAPAPKRERKAPAAKRPGRREEAK